MGPARQASHDVLDQRRPPDGHADHSLEQPLAPEFAPPRAGVALEARARREVVEHGGGGELGAAQRAVDPLAGKWIEEVGGIADEQRAAAARHGAARPAGERTGREDAADDPARVEAPADAGEAIELLEKPFAPACLLHGYDERDRGDAVPDRSE